MSVTTVFDLLKDELAYTNKIDNVLHKQGKIALPSLIEGLKPHPIPTTEGLVRLTPEQLLSLKVDVVAVNGKVVGYQRDFKLRHARQISQGLLEGVNVPPINVALDGRGNFWAVDGQHRAAGGAIARVPVWAAIQRIDKDARRSMFLSQQKALRVAPDILTLAGTDPIARYIQNAVTDSSNPWNTIVSASRSSKTKISPYAAYQLLLRYVFNVEGQAASYKTNMDDKWDRGLADELAPLIACFGDKQSNPDAFKPGTVQSIGATAMWVFRRTTPLDSDRERWVIHMPTYDFKPHSWVKTQQERTELLLRHWNKRLSRPRQTRRV